MPDFVTALVAFVGGMLPAFAWLWFWLREDAEHPEPRRLITYAFIAGMATVAIVVPIELFVKMLLVGDTAVFTAWSAIEEVMKFAAASMVVLWRREDDEPIDAVIYMIVVGLGFAAAENTIFLLSPISGSTVFQTILSGNFRFVGATLVHVLSSATVGIALALAFYRSRRTRILFAICGVLLCMWL